MTAESPARRRNAFVRRVARGLANTEGTDLLAPDPDVSEASMATPHPDFLLVALDLRLRVYLNHEGLLESDRVKVARDLLIQWPDSAAVMIVEDDADLTTSLFEPFDVMVQISGGAPSATVGPNSMASVLAEYLYVLFFKWDPPQSLLDIEPLNMERVASAAARTALTKLESDRVKVAEKQAALAQVRGVEPSILISLVNEVVAGSNSELSVEDFVRRMGAPE